MSLDQLTTRQREVLDFIRDKIKGRGYGPTVREIGEHFDILSA
jgi:repressor LexA